MNQSTYRISLDIHSVASQLSFSINRGDNMRRLIITLTENGKTYEITDDCYAIFTTVKPDGTHIANDCTIQDNTIIYDFTEQTTAVAGKLDCSVIVFNTKNERITSPRFTVIVYETNHQDISLTSESEYTTLVSQLAESKECIEEMNALIDTVNKERVSGEYDGVSITDVTVLESGVVESGQKYTLDIALSDGNVISNSFVAPQGERGVGIPSGGTTGQILTKTENGTAWQDAPSGGASFSYYSLKPYEDYVGGTMACVPSLADIQKIEIDSYIMDAQIFTGSGTSPFVKVFDSNIGVGGANVLYENGVKNDISFVIDYIESRIYWDIGSSLILPTTINTGSYDYYHIYEIILKIYPKEA